MTDLPLNKTSVNPEIVARIEKGFLAEKKSTAVSYFDSNPALVAAAVSATAAINRQISALIFHGLEFSYREASATQQLMAHWGITREELNGRLQQIADANPGDWSDKSAHRVWVCVLVAGITFDAEGKLEPKSLPFLKQYEPKFEFKSRFSL